ncbi:MAG: hypothetical protein CVU05_00440 [Bacteroidetes bacterium HGW-Bacteroidetes-21]|nr:MAG: hypothetical protein CVU05_00440 [Bacteroidetes bacterium HGW-Bacteroidetes-21]
MKIALLLLFSLVYSISVYSESKNTTSLTQDEDQVFSSYSPLPLNNHPSNKVNNYSGIETCSFEFNSFKIPRFAKQILVFSELYIADNDEYVFCRDLNIFLFLLFHNFRN